MRNRPFACRYGCGSAYNDSGSRHTHEKKKHGASFPRARAAEEEEAETNAAVNAIPGYQQQQQVQQQQQMQQLQQVQQQQMADGRMVYHIPVVGGSAYN